MYCEVGTVLYLYTIRSGEFRVHKGKVIKGKYGNKYAVYHKVHFETRAAKEFCPKVNEIGVIQTGGPRLWLTERDDKKAAEMFIEFEKNKLAELEAKVDKKKALIKTLESVGMEG